MGRGDKSVRQVGRPKGRPPVSGPFAASLWWAALVIVSPWIPRALDVTDLSGVSVVLSMLAFGSVPSLLLGIRLGRARACEVLGVCAALGPWLWILDFAVFGDPSVHSPYWEEIVVPGIFAACLVVAPLAGGAFAGWCCRQFRPIG